MMGWEQRNADFCKAQTDAQMAYIEAEREVDQLQAENAKLREQLEYDRQTSRSRLESIDRLKTENAKLRELVRDVVLLAGLNGCDVTEMRLHAHGGDWRTVWERMRELGVDK